jgi:uncharacterized protein (DUF362 family)
MADSISRREALTRVGAAAGTLAAVATVGLWRWDRHANAQARDTSARQVRDFRVSGASDQPDFVVASGTSDAASLTDKALAAMGGMARFIARGDVVAIKPNIGWDRTPSQAANTNPDVVAALVKAALDAGAKRVVVTDNSCNEPQRSFQRSGIWEKAAAVGAQVVLPADNHLRTLRMHGEVLDEWPILIPIIEADKVINVPIVKHHGLAKLTCAMKNWYGLLGGRRNRLHQDIDTSIADLATFMRPTLTVVDATRVLYRNGPQGGNLGDTRQLDTVIASLDQVAADAYACTLINQKPDDIGYLKIAQRRGLGTMDWASLKVRQV